jgi:hypothetical protein
LLSKSVCDIGPKHTHIECFNFLRMPSYLIKGPKLRCSLPDTVRNAVRMLHYLHEQELPFSGLTVFTQIGKCERLFPFIPSPPPPPLLATLSICLYLKGWIQPDLVGVGAAQTLVIVWMPTMAKCCLVPSRFQRGEGKTRKNSLLGARRIMALPGNDITATDLYRLQLHCTVPNEGPAEEAGSSVYNHHCRTQSPSYARSTERDKGLWPNPYQTGI